MTHRELTLSPVRRVSGESTRGAVVAVRRLALGEIIGPADVRPIRLRAELARGAPAETPAQLVGKQLRRPVTAEQPIQLADVTPPALVERNALVTLVLEAPGMQLTAGGRALEAAPRGATVRVVNLMSQSVVEGVVVAPGRVRVGAGATPVAVAARR